MNELKKYLKENRDIFDTEEPLDGHFERFEERLNSSVTKRKRRIWLVTTFSAAVSILLVVAAGIWLLKPAETNPEQTVSEFVETEAFYREQMNEKIAAILCKLDKADDETRTQLEKDLQEIIDDSKSFVEEIKEYGNEELSIYYMMEYYNDNLQTLQFINDKLGEYFSC